MPQLIRNLGAAAAAALVIAACNEPVAPRAAPPVPSFSYSPSGVALDQTNGTLAQINQQVLIKGFNPTNPHRGDAIVVTFFWVGGPGTNIIDEVTDVLTDV